MAITIRFPNGQAIRYNTLGYYVQQADGYVLLKKTDTSGWSVRVPRECVIESMDPCEVSNPLTDKEKALDILIKGIRGVRDLYKLADLKRALQQFNATTKTWNKGE
jgi:hypothetical protein